MLIFQCIVSMKTFEFVVSDHLSGKGLSKILIQQNEKLDLETQCLVNKDTTVPRP